VANEEKEKEVNRRRLIRRVIRRVIIKWSKRKETEV
jgi:hypothetical protein